MLELPVSAILPLIGNTGTGASDVNRRERRGEDETGGVRANSVDEIGRTSDVSADSTVSLAKGT